MARRTAGNRTTPSGSQTHSLEITDIQPQPTVQGGLVRVALSSRRTERFIDFFARSFFGGKPSRLSQQTPRYPFSLSTRVFACLPCALPPIRRGLCRIAGSSGRFVPWLQDNMKHHFLPCAARMVSVLCETYAPDPSVTCTERRALHASDPAPHTEFPRRKLISHASDFMTSSTVFSSST